MTKKIVFSIFTVCFILSISGCASTEKEVSVQELIKENKIEEAKAKFISKYDINGVDNDGNTALHIAAEINDASLALFLLCNGADPDLKNYKSQTPLHVAVEKNSKETAQQLINYGCNIFARDADGHTAMENGFQKDSSFYDIFITEKTAGLRDSMTGKTIVHYFVEDKDEMAVFTCVRKNIPLSPRDNEQKTPLDYAFSNMENSGMAEIAAILITNGADPVESNFDYFQTAVSDRNINYRFEDGQTPLHYAAIAGHKTIAKYLLENNAATNVQDSSGATPLHEAVRYGRTGIAKMLLDAGASVDAKDNLGKTPVLLIIPEKQRLELYSLLISYKSDMTGKDMYGDTVLHTATMTDVSTEILSLLVKAGADINARNKDGVTPLALAIENKLSSHINFYAGHGADINSKDQKGNTPLKMALRADDSSDKTLEIILNSQNIDSLDSDGNTPLITAIAENATQEKIQYILSLTDNVNARNSDGNTALYLTVLKNRRTIGEKLLAKNADIFSTNNKNNSPLSQALRNPQIMEWLITSKTIKDTDGIGNTALHYATEWGLQNAVETLITKGADKEAKNANGETPVFSACKNNNPEIIALLAKKGCKINVRDNLGSTPLHVAVRWGNTDDAEQLINLGCNIDAQNVTGKTPLAEAVLGGKTEIAKMLLSKGANPNISDINGRTILMDAVKAKNTRTIAMLLENNANPQAQDLNGRNSYHEAALTADEKVIGLIRNAGGNPLSRDKNGNTPFSLCLDKPTPVIKAILGSNTSISDSDGNTPLHIAVQNNKSVEMLKMLISSGYPIDARNSEGFTPLAIAIEKNYKLLALSLLESGSNPFIQIDSSGNNAALIALKNNNKAILEGIVKYSGSMSDIQGNSILHYAARLSSATTIKNLISYGLDKNVKNIYDETPYTIAVRWKRSDAAGLLKPSDAK